MGDPGTSEYARSDGPPPAPAPEPSPTAADRGEAAPRRGAAAAVGGRPPGVWVEPGSAGAEARENQLRKRPQPGMSRASRSNICTRSGTVFQAEAGMMRGDIAGKPRNTLGSDEFVVTSWPDRLQPRLADPVDRPESLRCG